MKNSDYSIGEITPALPAFVRQIVAGVCERYGIKPEELRSGSIERELVQARHDVIYLLRTLCDTRRLTIADAVGFTTNEGVRYGYRTMCMQMCSDERTQKRISEISLAVFALDAKAA